MNTTPEERAEEEVLCPTCDCGNHELHHSGGRCESTKWVCDCKWRATDALRARAEAAEADNAALLEALRKSAIRYESAASLWVTCSLCSRSWDTPGEHHEGCILAQPHPGDALRERLRLAEKVLEDLRLVGPIPRTRYDVRKVLAAYDAAREAGQ